MTRLVLLDKNIHQHLRVDIQAAEAQGATLHMVPVMLSEFLKLAVQYPIAFAKNKETGRFVCVAMLGFIPGENLFWKNNAWDSLYIPLQIARQPFFLGQDDSTENHFVICIDADNECIKGKEGEILFDTQGNETPYMEKAKSMLAELLEGEAKTENFTKKLLDLKLLQPMRLEITFCNEESTTVEGMYTINEERMDSLLPQELSELHALGYLKHIYTMITSLGHIYGLVNRKNSLLAK